MEAMWDCASQLWVPGDSCGHGRPYLSFCPITLRHYSFRYRWVCRWMQNSKRSRMVPFFVWVGASEGEFGGWVVPQGCPPQKVYVPSRKETPSCVWWWWWKKPQLGSRLHTGRQRVFWTSNEKNINYFSSKTIQFLAAVANAAVVNVDSSVSTKL